MRVLVCGGRHFEDSRLLWQELDLVRSEYGIDLIITGGARGADWLAELYAEKKGIKCDVYLADWEAHGRGAGPIRNREMLNNGRPDMVVAFPGGNGTGDMIRKAKAAGVTVKEIAK